MSIARHHNEWLSLVPNSGPFLSLPVLAQAFPQGLDAHDADHARRLRLAFDEWDDNQSSPRPDPGIHRAWIKLVLGETLSYDELLVEGQAIPQTLKSDVAEYGETLRPDWIVNDPATKKARLLVQVYPRSQSLTKPVALSRWKTSPDTRMMQLLHDTGIRLGIVTNGDHWMLVNAPKNETTGYVSWYANLWLEEPITLRAFRTLLGTDRFFSVPENETLEALLDKSADDQQEVTNQLGYQVRKAVEVLVQAIDKADQDHGRRLLADVDEKVLYESALTIMMRLVFLFCAEERELLLLGDDLYDKNYAVSTLREQLRIAADQFGEEILGLRYDAWPRLVTSFRAVYAGAKHHRLNLPAYGGNLFNPDRFPFLEGRKLGTSWKITEAVPLPVSNRTVLHLLESLQVLQVRSPGGGVAEARKLSFRSLDIEQIGHVYEGLLDHTAKRATEPMLGLQGTRDKEPEIALAELEKVAAKGEKELLKFLKDETGRSESALKKGLNAELDDQLISRFRTACQDSELWKRMKPFAGLVRLDTVDYPVVVTPGSVFVTAGTDRRSSGTHYTPKSLTEPIVQYTLEPLVYVGPAEGLPKDQWKLRSARELLDLKICDMACGSGAFLVQACRYMAARLLEAWDAVQRANPGTVRITPEGEPSSGQPGEMLIPDDPDERQIYALRIVAQRCLYGVDKNPLAAEMAKLSLWLLTLAKDKPFAFLDHAIRSGDSLVGVNDEQLKTFSLDSKGVGVTLPNFLNMIPKIMEAIRLLRFRLEKIADEKISDIEEKERLFANIQHQTKRLDYAADRLMAASWKPAKPSERIALLREALREVDDRIRDVAPNILQAEGRVCREEVGCPQPFHWALEFPEVFLDRGGFDALIGNPPFQFGTLATTALSPSYMRYIQNQFSPWHGKADLVGAFLPKAELIANPRGFLGLIATASLVRGETVESSIIPILEKGSVLYRAISPRQWPGDASVTIVDVWLAKANWDGAFVLDSDLVDGIGPDLEPNSEHLFGVRELCNKCPVGMMGIKLSPGNVAVHRDLWASLSHTVQAAMMPAVGGHELYQCIEIEESLYVFEPELTTIQILGEFNDATVGHISIGQIQHSRPAQKLREALTTAALAFACAETCHVQLAFVEVPTCGIIPKHTSFVFPADDWLMFAILQSSLHNEWFLKYGIRCKGSPRYSAKRCAATFPLPNERESQTRITGAGLSKLGQTYHNYRKMIIHSLHEGVTSVYNRFHAQEETAADIQKLRQLHVEMDNAVAAAYGWSDLDLGHGFHETKQGVRFTISEPARREVLARLLKLNHERYAEEVRQGLHDKKKPKASKGKKTSEVASTGPSLFGEDD